MLLPPASIINKTVVFQSENIHDFLASNSYLDSPALGALQLLPFLADVFAAHEPAATLHIKKNLLLRIRGICGFLNLSSDLSEWFHTYDAGTDIRPTVVS